MKKYERVFIGEVKQIEGKCFRVDEVGPIGGNVWHVPYIPV